MIKVTSTMSKKDIEMFGIKPPKNFQIVYIGRGFTDKEFIEKSKDSTFILSGLGTINKNIIDNLENVKLIQSIGVGYNNIDIEAARKRGIYVANAKGVNKESVAEHTIGLMLAAIRGIVQADKDIKIFKYRERRKKYRKKDTKTFKSTHVGLIGLGDIGIEVVKRLKPFGCKISYYSHSRKKAKENEYNLEYLNLEELLKECDIVSLHIPLTDNTENMIDKDKLKWMKKDSILVNTARGKIVNQFDLARALTDGEIGMAALDTMDPEPPGEDHPLLNMPEEAKEKLILTTHIAGATREDLKNMQKNAWDNMNRVLNGEKPLHIVNKL